MATISRLSIMIDANASGVSKGIAPVTKQLDKFKSAVTGAFMGGGAVAATFLSVEKIIGRITRSFADADRLAKEGLISQEQLANVKAMQTAWKGINDGLSSFILQVASAVAPTFLVVVDNLKAMLGPLIDADGLMRSFGEWVEWTAAQFANLQAIVSGGFLMWQVVSDAFFGKWLLKIEMVKAAMEQLTGQDLFDNDGAVERINSELKAMLDQFEAGQEMLASGLDGSAGRAVMAQIEAKKAEIQSVAQLAETKTKDLEAKIAKFQALQPAAFEMGSAASASAINQARADGDKQAQKLWQQQVKELQAIRRAVEKPTLAAANL